jgi:hypothetical protein
MLLFNQEMIKTLMIIITSITEILQFKNLKLQYFGSHINLKK